MIPEKQHFHTYRNDYGSVFHHSLLPYYDKNGIFHQLAFRVTPPIPGPTSSTTASLSCCSVRCEDDCPLLCCSSCNLAACRPSSRRACVCVCAHWCERALVVEHLASLLAGQECARLRWMRVEMCSVLRTRPLPTCKGASVSRTGGGGGIGGMCCFNQSSNSVSPRFVFSACVCVC